MTEENLNPEEESQDKPTQEGVSVEDFKNLQKGVQKLAESFNSLKSSENKEAKDESDGKPEDKSEVKPAPLSNVVKNLYLEKNPEFAEVEDEVMEESRQLGIDPIDYYESKQGWKLEAKARVQAKEEKEKAKSSIDNPSGKPAGADSLDYSKVKADQIKNLSPEQMDKYREYLRTNSPKAEIKRRN